MNLLANLRYTLRQIVKNPGFFLVAIAALALGIGANTAIFSAVDAVLLRPLPYANPGRLVMVWEDASFIGFALNTPAPANYVDWKAQNQVFTDMTATRYTTAKLTGDRQPEQLSGRKVTPNFFDVLGVQPAVGRQFTEAEAKAQSPVVALSHNLWQRRYGGGGFPGGPAVPLGAIQTTRGGNIPRGVFFFSTRNT